MGDHTGTGIPEESYLPWFYRKTVCTLLQSRVAAEDSREFVVDQVRD
ncbi:MAG: hypothetical protein WCK86_00945 [Planctomycetia bacterium]